MEFPGFYFNNAKFVPNQQNYILTLGWHVIPKSFNQQIQTTYIDGEIEEGTFEDIIDKTGRSIIVSLC